MRTFTEHIALQIAIALPRKKGTLFITGGAYNDFLIERIQFHLPSIKIIIPENTILEFKEAVIFALPS
jgi:anhydro-N-acetylmuramic acid kinase